MTTENVLKPIDINRNMDNSPSCKRARYESPVQDRWSLAQNDIVLDEVYDYGVSLLVDSESDCATDEDRDCDGLSRNEKNEQSTISKETLKKISHDDWELELRKIATNNIVTMNHFEKLSDEMVLHILHFLPKKSLNITSLVCKRWFHLSQDESLWARLDLSFHQLEPGALGRVMSRQVMILRLAQAEIYYPPIMPGCCAFSDDFRSRLLLLDLSMVTTTCDTLVEIFKRCRRLKKVSLEHVKTDDNVFAALSLSKDLEVLNLAMVEGITERSLRYLLENCKKVRELNLAWTYLSAGSTQYICSNLPLCIDRLNVSGCRKLINDRDVLELVTRCKNLRELDLSDCTSLTGAAIGYITQLKDLNFLALSRCYQISYRSLLQLKKIPSLLYLDVHGGYVDTSELRHIQDSLGSHVQINKFKFSSVARPTVGTRRSSIWNMRVRD